MTAEQFTALMVKAAKIQPKGAPNFKDPDVADFWFRQMKDTDAMTLRKAMVGLVCKSFFPSIEDVQKQVGAITEMTDEDTARDVVARIRENIGLLGYVAKDEDVEKKIGSLGMYLVRSSGGWSNLCQSFDSYHDLDIHLAQMRERAKGVLKKSREGTLDLPPQLPEPRSNNKVTALIAEAAQNCDITARRPENVAND